MNTRFALIQLKLLTPMMIRRAMTMRRPTPIITGVPITTISVTIAVSL